MQNTTCSFSNRFSHSEYSGSRSDTERERKDNHQGSKEDWGKSFTLAIIWYKTLHNSEFCAKRGKQTNKQKTVT